MEERELFLLEQPASRSFDDGIVWIRQGFSLMTQRFGTLLLISLIMNVCCISVVVMFGFLGDIASQVGSLLGNILPIWFGGGFMLAIASLAEEDDLEIEYLFAGFKYKFKELTIFFLLCLLLALPLIVIGVAAFFMYFSALKSGSISGSFSTFILVSMMIFVPYVLLMMAAWLSFPLIMLHDVKPWQSIKMSFSGSLKNIAPMISAGLILSLMGLGIGLCFALLINLPLIVMFIFGIIFILIFILITPIFNYAFVYAAYRNIWTNLPMK